MTNVTALLRRPARPSPEAMQRAVIRVYQLGSLTPESATDQLIRNGMDPVAAARAIADAIKVKA